MYYNMDKITKKKYTTPIVVYLHNIRIKSFPKKYDKKINKDNMHNFMYRLFDNGDFKCVLCKRKVSIDNSYSKMGYKLICSNCLYNKFIFFSKYREWTDR